MRPRQHPVRSTVAALFVLAVVLAVLLHESILPGKGLSAADGIFAFLPWSEQATHAASNPLLVDQYLRFDPTRHWHHANLRQGRFPLWNPFISCGAPALAASQNAILFPIRLLYSLLDPLRAAAAEAFSKLLCAGFFTFIFVRRLGVGFSGALLSGIAFGLCGFMVVWLGHPHVNCAMWLPLLLYFIEGQFAARAAGAGSRFPFRATAGFSIAFGFMLLGGHPPTSLHVAAASILYFLFRLFSGDDGAPKRIHLRSLLVGMAAGFLLAAPQVLPFLEYYGLSSAPLTSANIERASTSLDVKTFVNYLLPMIAGSPVRNFENLGQFFQLTPAESFNERSGFVGVLTVFLALAAALHVRDRRVLFFAALGAASACVVLGLWPVPLILGSLPVIGSINHTRLILLICFSLAVLAGFGLDRLHEIRNKRWFRSSLGASMIAAACLAGWVLRRLEPALTSDQEGVNPFIYEQLAMFAAGMTLVLFVSLGPKRLSAPVSLCWVSIELLWFGMGYNPAIPRYDYYPAAPSIRFLQRDDSMFRISGIDGVLPPNTGEVYGLYDVRGQDFMTVRRYEEFVTGAAGDFWFYSSNARLTPSLLLSNTRYILTRPDHELPASNFTRVYQGEVDIYEIHPFLERAMLVYGHEVIRNRYEILRRLWSPGFDPREIVILERPPKPAVTGPEQAKSALEPRVEMVRYEADEVTIELASPKPGFLLLLDTHFPGWKAFVDERPAEIYRANLNFRAVAVPAGESTVRFRYRPLSFRLGILLCLVGVGFILWFWAHAAAGQPARSDRSR